MNILISNVYCYQNHGDAGIVEATICGLKERFPTAKITVASLYPSLDQGRYGDGIEVISAPALPMSQTHSSRLGKYLSILGKTIEVMGKALVYRIGIFPGSSASFKNADLVVSCGGGYMQSRSIRQLLADYSVHWIQLFCAKSAKIPYIIFAQTIGPFDSVSRRVSKSIFDGAARVLAREPISFKCVEELYPEVDCKYTADVAFLLKAAPVGWEAGHHRDGNVGITVRSWHFPGKENRDQLLGNYIEAIEEFVVELSKRGDYGFYLMPQCIGPDTDNDLILSRRIAQDLEGSCNLAVVDLDCKPSELKFIYSKMDYFVGTRMHSVIFSLAEDVPCIAISYDRKTDGIMEQAGLSDYVLDISTVTKAKLLDRFNALVSDEQVKEKIYRNVKAIKKQASINFDEVEAVLENER